MHILDDLTGLSTRAQSFIERTGWREQPQDRPIASTALLTTRRDEFALRYAGLRYRVRNVFIHGGERYESTRIWDYDLGHHLWADPAGGGHFGWIGEHVSSPVGYLIHTDGRVGVDYGDAVFLEIAPSIHALIESHSLTDMVSTWDRVPAGREPLRLARGLTGLDEVPEASGPTIRWRLSDHVAVQEFQRWNRTEPREWFACIWSNGEVGRRQVEKATAAL